MLSGDLYFKREFIDISYGFNFEVIPLFQLILILYNYRVDLKFRKICLVDYCISLVKVI